MTREGWIGMALFALAAALFVLAARHDHSTAVLAILVGLGGGCAGFGLYFARSDARRRG